VELLFALLTTLLKSPERDAEDRDMLHRIQNGDETGLADLYDRYGQLLNGFVTRILRSVVEAEELVQEIFLQVWKKGDAYQENKGTVYTWLMTLTRNRAIDRLRSKDFKNHVDQIDVSTLMLAAEPQSSNPQTRTIMGEDRQLVNGVLQQLSVDQQQVIALAYYEGFSQSEIAEKLNIPLGTVKSRIRNGLITMRSKLQKKI